MAETGSRNDPYSGFRYLVEIGADSAGFSECSGISSETAVIEYRNGDEDIRVRKLPGLKSVTNITLKRGMTKSLGLWEWRKTVMDGKTERRDGTVTLQDEAGQPVLRWTFEQGWPSKWEGPALNATGNEVAIETLEIAFEDLKLETA